MKLLNHLEEFLIATLMAMATLITFVAALHRYLSGLEIPVLQDFLISINASWAQELTVLMFIWMAKFGAAYGVRTGIHVGVDVLVIRLSDKNRRRCILLSLAAGAIFTGVIGTLGVILCANTFEHGNITDAMELPVWMVYLAIPLGSYLMSFRFLQVGWNYLQTGEVPKHDHTHVEGLDEEVVA